MATRQYESVVIISATLDDSQIEQTISGIQETIKINGGEITDTEDWGRKRLAYLINKAKNGYYFITRFSAEPSLISIFERALKLDEHIIKYITITLDKKALQHLEAVSEQKSAEQKSKEQEPKVEAKTEEKSVKEKSKD